jgi:hypothetical protein
VIWALHDLGATGWDDAAVALVDRYRARPDFGEMASPTSYWMGECGIALVAYRLSGDAGLADRVHELVLANLDSPTNEVMWGTPGTMLVAEAMLASTGEPRWDEAWRVSADRVLAARDEDGLWTQDLYGRVWRFLGPAHGYAGTVRALGNRGPAQVADLSPYLLQEDGLVNWMPTTEATPEEIRVQWCHGAPGMVATLGELLDPALAVAGGELTWRAGPIARGPGLPRHGRQRVRVPRPSSPDGRRPLARAGARVRDARARPGRAGTSRRRPRPLLALHRRRRRRAVPPPPARRRGPVPDDGPVLGLAVR